MGMAFSPDGKLWVADKENHRVLAFDGGTSGDTIADHVIGQIDFTHNAPNFLDEACLCFPRDVALDRSVEPNRVYIADSANNRVLAFTSAGDGDMYLRASLVLGQPDMYSNAFGTGPSSLNFPVSVKVGPDAGVYVADRDNNRVLYFENPFETDTEADLVFGQPDFESSQPNAGGPASASTLNRPEGVAIDNERNVYVGDSRNHRALRYNRPQETDSVADVVWGQFGSFASGGENAAGSSRPGTFSYPFRLSVSDDGILAVADVGNHRIQLFDTNAEDPFQPVKVLGQEGDFSSSQDNRGGRSAKSLSGPEAVVFVGRDLYVADTANCRVLFFRNPLETDDAAVQVYGQFGNFTKSASVELGTSARSLWFPSGLDVDGEGSLFVADREQSRVVVFQSVVPSSL